ncbi:MarR family transcriptional regulator [Deinococcus sp. HMF7620]|uniref:Manganese transport regulator n=1 Tax=Deinococcus arboris TaxID=2682977 RepID=A0A7C9LQW1_9DEIO|nr:metal-dependent transcriptional regulator [Deinococcus arboris]MVN88896.1 MarR family transcriptional regulator [Deinococcus arboris]
MTHRTLSSAVEDYLKYLYLLGQQSAVNTQALADTLGVNPASVTGMLRRLTEQGLVTHLPYKGARLTPEGEAVALEVLRHHRLLELYLHEALGIPLDEVHEEAEQLEHVISEKLEARIAAWLGQPAFDPHGDPIPSLDGTLPSRSEVSLTAAAPGAPVCILRVPHDPAALKGLMAHGLTPGVTVTLLETSPALGTVTVQVSGAASLVLSVTLARQVRVAQGVSA